jgi:hypothetical protein
MLGLKAIPGDMQATRTVVIARHTGSEPRDWISSTRPSATLVTARSHVAIGAIKVCKFRGELVAQALGFWRYPSNESGRGPLLLYPLAILVFAVLSLIGWRVMRRFGWRGELVFLAVVAGAGHVPGLLRGRAGTRGH